MTKAEKHASRRSAQQLRALRERSERKYFVTLERRRAEDRIREELHDSRAKTISGTKVGNP